MSGSGYLLVTLMSKPGPNTSTGPSSSSDDNSQTLVRLLSFVEKDVESGCWLWCGAMAKGGYGSFWWNGKSVSAHRASYVLHYGEVPDGLEIDHLCKQRKCCNPLHLEAVTHEENCRRSLSANRRKTHCPKGHRYTPENTMLSPHPAGHISRKCRTCHNARNSKKKRKLRSRAKPATGRG